jgi:hypothetical protein
MWGLMMKMLVKRLLLLVAACQWRSLTIVSLDEGLRFCRKMMSLLRDSGALREGGAEAPGVRAWR